MIVGVTGLPGAGKSYHLVGEILKWLKRPGAGVISNFHPSSLAQATYGDRWRFGLWSDMVEAPPNTLCVVDEANMWFSSREWKNQSSADLAVFKQSRKHGLSLWWSDQHENRVDCAIREVTHWYHRIERAYGVSVVRVEDPASGKKAGVWLLHRNKRVWDYYDSYEVIGTRTGEGYGSGRAQASGGPEPAVVEEGALELWRYEIGGRVVFMKEKVPVWRGERVVVTVRRSELPTLAAALRRCFT